MGADGDDQLCAALVGEEKGDVLADSRCGDGREGSPSAVRRSDPGARPSAYAWTSSSAPERSAASETESKSPTITCGLSPISSSASAPPSTATSTGLKFLMYGRTILRSLL